MLGVRVVDAAPPATSGPYRDAAQPSLRIAVRNPPVLTAFAIALTALALTALVGLVVFGGEPLTPASVWRLPAVAIGLSIGLSAALRALRPHTLLAVDHRELLVERAKQGPGARVALPAIERFERDPATGGIVAHTAAGPVVIATGLLPEQVALVRSALDRALGADARSTPA